MSQFAFNAAEVSPESQFTPVPNGEYPVVITESEMKKTKNGEGQYLQLVLEIIEGHYKGRKVWERLNIVNKNQTAVEIAQRALSQICHAVNHLQLTDTVELHNKPMVAKLVVRQQAGYSDTNEVEEYKAYSSGPGPAPAHAAPTPPPQQSAPATNKPAWAS